MELLTSDALFSLAIQLDLADLLKFCSTSKKINSAICNKDNIWLFKLSHQFPNWKSLTSDTTPLALKDPISLQPLINMKTPRNIYITLYHWNIFKVLKEKLKIKEDLYQIYNLQTLYLNNNKLTQIPQEIGQLTNLQWVSFRDAFKNKNWTVDVVCHLSDEEFIMWSKARELLPSL